MLISKDHHGGKGSVYCCDRCGLELNSHNDDCYRINAMKLPEYSKAIKKWDLCKRCYLMLCKGIKKGVERKEDKENGNGKEM